MEALTKLDGWWVGVHLGRPPMNCLVQIVIVDCHVMSSCSCVRFYLWYFAVLVGVAHCDDDVGCCCWLLMKRRTKIVDGKSRPAVRRWLTGRLAIKGTARICASRYLLRIMCASRYLFLVSHDIWKASSKKSRFFSKSRVSVVRACKPNTIIKFNGKIYFSFLIPK